MTDFELFKILIRIFSLKGHIFLLLLLVISMCIKKLQDDQYNEFIIIVEMAFQLARFIGSSSFSRPPWPPCWPAFGGQ